MIVSICEKCSEGCSHCFINSLPRSPVMTEETLGQTIEFLKWLRNPVLLLSGGEFTEHPNFFEFVTRIIVEARAPFGLKVLLLSNGSWFFDDAKREKMKILVDRDEVEMLQVRTHSKFYPNYPRTWAAEKEIKAFSPKVMMYRDGIRLFPLGRARANHKEEIECTMPSCANLFLLAKQGTVRDFQELIQYHEAILNKFCKPFVSSKGVIHAGETPFCEEIGKVTDDNATIFNNILTRCKPKNKCGLVKNMPKAAMEILYS